MKHFIVKNSLYFAWIVSIVATCGSLYLSEILHYVPCELCWYQRIFMYPMTVLLAISLFTGDRNVTKYTIPLSIMGGCISIYHYLIQMVPSLQETAFCSTKAVSCITKQISFFGFITIPFLALIAFILIITFSLISKKGQ